MKNIQKLIIEIEDRKKLHEQNYRNGKINYSNWQGRKTECNFFIQSLNLLLNEQPEAITDDAQFRKHDVSGSAIDVVKWIDGCPVTIDEATIPKAGIDAAPQQVVVNLSLSYQWWLKLKDVAKHCR